MAHVLIATTHGQYQRMLADLLTAAGHHVVTTSDTGLARAALCLSERRIVALLAEAGSGGRGMLDVALSSSQMWGESEDIRHTYILLTQQPPSELSTGLRALLAADRATHLPLDCSIGALLTAVEVASERLTSNVAARKPVESAALVGCAS